MDTCVVDKVPDRFVPPSKMAIKEARDRQLAAVQELRRLLKQTWHSTPN